LLLCGIEEVARKLDARAQEPLAELRPDARGPVVAAHTSVLLHSLLLEYEDVLRGDHVLFHPDDLGDADDLPRAVAETGDVDDRVERGGDVIAHGAHREREARHEDHRIGRAAWR